MKFSKQLSAYSNAEYRQYYIAYKDLKKAIKLITGADTSTYTIQEVTTNFGNTKALAGSIYRPPESRFQDLLNHELEKINKFTDITANAIFDVLLFITRKFHEGVDDAAELELLERRTEQQAHTRQIKNQPDRQGNKIAKTTIFFFFCFATSQNS
eukprot:GHVT01102114.1.p1 GENE.GHVT01102114.1~~GHVT01102114.1.p1  ORF type:complete len:155 (+),score=33.73 GHVT01102114.1:375-839(+)